MGQTPKTVTYFSQSAVVFQIFRQRHGSANVTNRARRVTLGHIAKETLCYPFPQLRTFVGATQGQNLR